MNNNTIFDNNTKTINLTEPDFFEDLYSDSVLKQTTMAIFYTGVLFGLILEFGIIWYERGGGNQRYRTAINQLFSTISWIVVTFIFFVYIPEGVRYLVGPLNPVICDVHFCLKNFFSACFILTFDCITLLRYVFIFKLSNFAVINDDLIAKFLQLTILLLSVWVATVKRMSVGRMPLAYLICAGKDPDEEQLISHPDDVIYKFDTTGILVVASVVFNVFVFIKIFIYQRKMELDTRNIHLGRIKPSTNGAPCVAWTNSNTRNIISNVPKSMADLTTQILCLSFLMSNVAMIVARNRIDKIDLNKYENRWMTYYIQIIGFAVAMLGICIIYYIKNDNVPRAIWKTIKDQMKY